MSERRRTRVSKRTPGEDAEPMEPEPEPVHIRRSTRRTSVTTISRSHANGGQPQASVLAQSFQVDGQPVEVRPMQLLDASSGPAARARRAL
jgi:hypothetical protein